MVTLWIAWLILVVLVRRGLCAACDVRWSLTQPSIADGHDVVAFVVSSCFGLCCLPACVLQLGDTSACKMVSIQYSTAFDTANLVLDGRGRG